MDVASLRERALCEIRITLCGRCRAGTVVQVDQFYFLHFISRQSASDRAIERASERASKRAASKLASQQQARHKWPSAAFAWV